MSIYTLLFYFLFIIYTYIYIHMLYELILANSIAYVCCFMIGEYNDIYVDIDKNIYINIYI